MSSKKIRIRVLVWSLVFLVMVAGAYLYFNSYFNAVITLYHYSNRTTDFVKAPITKDQKDDIVAEVKSLKKFGDWPLGEVQLSSQRGNPFERKQIITSD